MDHEAQLRADIVRCCQQLHQKGYLAANDGNVSARLGSRRLLITPTGKHKGFLTPDQLLVIDESGRVLKGEGQPSGELSMHLTALGRRPDMEVVVHAHPPTAIALSLMPGLQLNGILPEVILSVGQLVVVPYARPISEAMGQSLHGHIDRHQALILERHGTLTLGQTVAEAYSLVERLEHAAQVLHLAYAMGQPSPLPESELAALQELHERSRT